MSTSSDDDEYGDDYEDDYSESSPQGQVRIVIQLFVIFQSTKVLLKE